MRAPWKWMVGSVVALTAMAFIVGMMTPPGVDVPVERTPIVIQDADLSTGSRPDRAAGERSTAGPTGASSPSPRRPPEQDRRVPDDDRVEVVNPGPDDIGTADDDAGRDDELDDDTEDDTEDDAGQDAGQDEAGDDAGERGDDD